MPVEEHRALAGARNLHEEHRRPVRQPHDLDVEALDRTLARPARRELDGPVQVTVSLPLAVEARRLRRDANVLLERGNDPRVPRVLRETSEPVGSIGWLSAAALGGWLVAQYGFGSLGVLTASAAGLGALLALAAWRARHC